MARSGFLLLLLAALLFDPRSAVAEVWRVTPKVSGYFHLLHPRATSGRLHTPLVLVVPDSGRVEHVISPFAGGSRDSSIEELLEVLNAERIPERAVTGVDDERYLAALAELARELPLRFPLVVLVRMETPRPGANPQIPTAHDESLEASLRAWESQQAANRDLLILALLAG